eukprot:TRINITY_DN2179_c0_g1_i8.p1 TRINITY_DN2179_c0_g1~~TRINITY_DN2179_c0_g1_i8.p1  ORF type:complete len:111 (-),score=13.66 TRINITY_DN2179_c0_g1_i8:3-335(-)
MISAHFFGFFPLSVIQQYLSRSNDDGKYQEINQSHEVHPSQMISNEERYRDNKSQYDLSLIHISEPTRLGMISYAVFCLKKKKNDKRDTQSNQKLTDQHDVSQYFSYTHL